MCEIFICFMNPGIFFVLPRSVYKLTKLVPKLTFVTLTSLAVLPAGPETSSICHFVRSASGRRLPRGWEGGARRGKDRRVKRSGSLRERKEPPVCRRPARRCGRPCEVYKDPLSRGRRPCQGYRGPSPYCGRHRIYQKFLLSM